MPSIKANITATTADALATRKFKTQGRPALVSLWVAGQAAGGLIGFSVGSQEFLVNGLINLEAADVLDTSRDQLMFQERVPAGEYFLPITLGGTDVTFLLVIEPIG